MRIYSNLFRTALIFLLGCTLLSCNPVNESNTSYDYYSLLPGHWQMTGSDEYTTETLSFNSLDWENSIVYEYVSYPGFSSENEYEIIARGTYALSGTVINMVFDKSVYVSIVENGVSGDSYKGFTDDVTSSTSYTIISCDGENMVLTDNSGNTTNWRKYKSI